MTQSKKPLLCLIWLIWLISALSAQAQTADVPLNNAVYHMIDRMDIKGMSDSIVYTDVKPYSYSYTAEVLKKGLANAKSKPEKEWIKLEQILWDDSIACAKPKKGILKTFYKNGRDLYYYRGKDLDIYVNPVFYLSAGADHNTYSGAGINQMTFRNSRGLVVRGTAFKRIGFYTEVQDNQAKYPEFIKRYNDSLPAVFGEGFYKTFKGNGFDFFSARGYITYSPFEKMRVKFGRDKLFLGNGYQSLFLSDNAVDNMFLNIVTKIWRLEYVNHFSQMVDYIPGKSDPFGTHPRKYAVFHQLSFKPWKSTSFSVFESVVYASKNPGVNRGFELEYLNPIIFYRSAEQFIGSPDNALLGFQFKWNFLKHFQAYGQGLIDDFNWRNRVNGSGYWGNKLALQAGGKYIDAFGVKRLDLQMEINSVRPYTYAHFNPSSAYTHYRQYLAHPMGSNFREIVMIARYQPVPRLGVFGLFSLLQKGMDTGGINYGANPFITNITHFTTYGNSLLQGSPLKVVTVLGKVTYQLKKLSTFLELEARYRKENAVSSLSVMGTLRMNIAYKPVKF